MTIFFSLRFLALLICIFISGFVLSLLSDRLYRTLQFLEERKLSEPLQSALSPGLEWCSHNPFLRGFSKTDVLSLEERWLNWTSHQLRTAHDALYSYAVSSEKALDVIVNLAYPTADPLPCPYTKSMVRYGTVRDSSKLLCGLEKLTEEDNCIIYSLGSNNDFDFEQALSNRTSCHMYTFDCTSKPPQKEIPRVHFGKICVGDRSQLHAYIYPHSEQKVDDVLIPESLFESFHQLVSNNLHTTVHVLKMDIESGEYSVFADVLQSGMNLNLPYQISFESHWWQRDIYHAILHQKLFSQLWKSGYRFMQHEFNQGDHSCVEWTLMRVFC